MSPRANRGAPPPPAHDTDDDQAAERWARDLASWRQAQGLTQVQVAERLGTTLRTYVRWEQGDTLPNGPARRKGWGQGDEDGGVLDWLQRIDRRLERIEASLKRGSLPAQG